MGIALFVALIGTLAVIALFVAIYNVVERPDDMAGRLELYAVLPQGSGDSRTKRRGLLHPLLTRLDRILSGQPVTQRAALHLAQANVRMTLTEFLVIELSATVVGGAVGFVLRGQMLSAVAGAVLGGAAPYLIVERKRSQRIKAFHDQLVDVLSLIVGSLRGGHALMTALDLVSKELPAPCSEEFTRVKREMGYGLSQTEALNNLVKRMESDDVQLIVTAVNISHEVGGNLSLVLEKIAETIRERIRLQGEIRVLTTQQRLTTYLLTALPFVLTLLFALINPSWMMRLFAPDPPWVRLIPIAAYGGAIIGFLIAQRLTKIEV